MCPRAQSVSEILGRREVLGLRAITGLQRAELREEQLRGTEAAAAWS